MFQTQIIKKQLHFKQPAGVGEEDVPYIPGSIYSSGSTGRLLEV